MKRRVSRRGLLVASVAAVSAGCNALNADRQREYNTTGRSETVPDSSTDQERTEARTDSASQPGVRSVRDYGAVGDGETDDTAAIQRAFDEALAGETVYFPAGTYVISARDSSSVNALMLDGDRHPPDLRIKGEGRDTTLLMEGGHEKQVYVTFRVSVKDGYDGLRIEDLVIDGNRQAQPGGPASSVGICLLVADANPAAKGNIDVRIKNVKTQNGKMNGFQARHGGVVMDNVTAMDNGRHGFALTTSRGAGIHDPPLRVRHAYSTGNGIENGLGYGFDLSGGKILLEDSVAEANAQGSKTTSDVLHATYRRVRFSNNGIFGYIKPGDESESNRRAKVSFDGVVSEYNGANGFRFAKDTDYTLGTILATENNRWTGHGNIRITDNASVKGTQIYAFDGGKGPGILYDSDRNSSLESYVHRGNAAGGLKVTKGGALAIKSNLVFSERLNYNFRVYDEIYVPSNEVGVKWDDERGETAARTS